MHKKIIDYHTYPSTYNIHVKMILPKCVLVHTQDENYNLILLSYVSTLYAIYITEEIII